MEKGGMNVKFIYRYIKPYKWAVILGLLIKFVGTISDLVLPSVLARLIDEEVPEKNVTGIVICGVVMLFFSVVAFLFNVIANRMAANVARKSCEKIRHDLFSKILMLSCKKTDDMTIPSLEARLTSDTYNLHNFIGRIQRIGVRAPILLVGGIMVTLLMDTYLTLILLATLPFIFFVVYTVSKKGIRLYKRLQDSVDDMVRVVRENALGVRVIKALSKSDYEIERFDDVNRTLSSRDRMASLVMGISNPIISFLLNAGLCLVILLGAFRVDSGLTEPGKIIAFMNYFIMISNAMLAITRVFIMTSKGIASADRIAEVVDTEDGIDRLYGQVSDEKSNAVEDPAFLSFKKVTFGYNKGKNVLEDIDFSLACGESLGIIGATGSGKSTILSLLYRFYEPDEGKILIDGKNICTYKKDEFRELFGVAMQNDFIFEGTLRENIVFGKEIQEKDIDKAVEISCAKEFVDGLSDGYEHEITSKGTNLSGGQRQRLLISRAIARNPKILVLDDSSSALDYKTDLLLRSAIKAGCRKDGVLVLVSQRVSTVKDCDLILVLDKGRIIGKGKHDDLLRNCEEYALIAKGQMGNVD